MIKNNLLYLHEDVKKYLTHNCSKLGWSPYFYQDIKNDIIEDMIRLNILCNQGNSRSFAICINDFLINSNNTVKFNEHKFNHLCQQTYGLDYRSKPQFGDLSNPSKKFSKLLHGALDGICCPSKDFKNMIIAYRISGSNPIEALAVPYHEYGHALELKYSLLDNTEAYQKFHQHIEDSDNPASRPQANQYFQEWKMLQESFADCFAYSCLTLKEPDNPLIYKKSLYNMALKFCNVIENKHNPLYCGYAATRTMLNKIGFDFRCKKMQKYYLADGTINFMKLAKLCAEVVTNQGYNHDNYQTLTTYPLQKQPSEPNLEPKQFDQWHYDYLDAQQTRLQNRITDPSARLFYGVCHTIINTKNKAEILSLLDKFDISGFQKYFNEYRAIINRKIAREQPTTLAQLIKQQKSRK